jgi:uncharacterized protein (DUF2147 family)
MPILCALSCGFVFSATVARNVGYTIAVPHPMMTDSITKCNMVFANIKTIKADEEWKGGDIYDPESGKTYSSYMYLKDKNILKSERLCRYILIWKN